MSNFFEVKNLCYSYIKKPLCLKDVSFFVKKNDVVLVLALDEMGKTTLINTLSGFDDKFFGQVLLNGTEIRKIEDSKKNFSIIFDEPILLKASIDKNLNFVYGTLNQEIPSNDEKIKLLELFGLNHKLDEKIKKLTLFEKFKFCILRSYVKNADVIFIDNILKNEFSNEQIEELNKILRFAFNNKLVFIFSNDKTFKTNRGFFEKLNPDKVLYLNNAVVRETDSISSFCDATFDLNSLCFCEDYSVVNASCFFQDENYYLNVNGNIIVKIDKNFNEGFETLKLEENENEDVVIAYNSSIHVDFLKNNDVNKLLKNKQIIVFSKLDGSRVL